MEEKLYPDSEGAWICEKHRKIRGDQKHGSNCYRCAKERIKELERQILEYRKMDKKEYHSAGLFDCLWEQVLKGSL